MRRCSAPLMRRMIACNKRASAPNLRKGFAVGAESRQGKPSWCAICANEAAYVGTQESGAGCPGGEVAFTRPRFRRIGSPKRISMCDGKSPIVSSGGKGK